MNRTNKSWCMQDNYSITWTGEYEKAATHLLLFNPPPPKKKGIELTNSHLVMCIKISKSSQGENKEQSSYHVISQDLYSQAGYAL